MQQRRFRLTDTQKQQAVLRLLATSKFPLTVYQMGTILGYANGVPLEDTMVYLIGTGEVAMMCENIEDQNCDVYFWLPGMFMEVIMPSGKVGHIG